MLKSLIALFASFVISLSLMPIIIDVLKKKHYGQTILGYVAEHKEKNGTVTMGGVVFVLTTLLLVFIFLKFDKSWFICWLVSVCFASLGYMDDYIKIKYKQNLGLKAYQKIIGQFGISILFALFVYFSNTNGSVFLPFNLSLINFKFWIIPIVVIIMLATTNSVNLTDGLDGLAGSVCFIYLLFFTAINTIVSYKLYQTGYTTKFLQDLENINILSMLFAGSILGFLLFNTNKASIFMGDVGSLCLGGFLGASCCLTGQVFLLPVLGFCFVFSALSVILQVVSFKSRHKRIFKMAPFHHHLQMSGLSEAKVVQIYSTTTFVVGVMCLIFYLL